MIKEYHDQEHNKKAIWVGGGVLTSSHVSSHAYFMTLHLYMQMHN